MILKGETYAVRGLSCSGHDEKGHVLMSTSSFQLRDRSPCWMAVMDCSLPKLRPCQGPPQDGINHLTCGVTLGCPCLPLSSCSLDTLLALVVRCFLQKPPTPTPFSLVPIPTPLLSPLASPMPLPQHNHRHPTPGSCILNQNASSCRSSAHPRAVNRSLQCRHTPGLSLRQFHVPPGI